MIFGYVYQLFQIKIEQHVHYEGGAEQDVTYGLCLNEKFL